MREALADLVKHASSTFPTIRINGSADETTAKGCDDEKTMFFQARLKQPIPEFDGEFGLTNMGLLSGLLNFTNYRTDDAKLSVKRRQHNGAETVEQIEFRNPVTGNDADFRVMSPDLVPEQAVIANIPWELSFVPNKAKIAEFQQLASMYAEVDKTFGFKTVNGNLIFYIGGETSSSHRVNMIFETDVKTELKGEILWDTARFLNFVKLAGTNPCTVNITTRGVLSVVIDTAHGEYHYFIRGNR